MNRMLKILTPIVSIFVALLAFIYMTAEINDAGQRTVIQTLDGKMTVKFTPGVYWTQFGKTTKYPDTVTLNYGKSTTTSNSPSQHSPIPVQFHNGSEGTASGKVTFALPTDEEEMIKLHKTYRTQKGLSTKLFQKITEEAAKSTASHIGSRELNFDNSRIHIQWIRDQINNGIYDKEIRKDSVTDPKTKESITTLLSVIKYDTNQKPIYIENDLKNYNISVSKAQITDWVFEKRQ